MSTNKLVNNPAVHAMFMFFGIGESDGGAEGVLEAWNGISVKKDLTNEEEIGFDNLFIILAKKAEKLSKAYDDLAGKLAEFPDEHYDRIFSMDVDEQFGVWIGNFILEYGYLPPEEDIDLKIKELIAEYTGE